MKPGSIKVIFAFIAVLSALLPPSEAGSKRRVNGSKGLSARDMRGSFGPSGFHRDFYDELPEFHDQIPVAHRESKEVAKLEPKEKDAAAARTCVDGTVTVSSNPSIFDLSSIWTSIFGTGTGDWGVSAGIVGIAVIIAIIWIKVIVAAFIAWIWWAGYGFGGGKGGGDGGYSYDTGSSAYGAPSYGAPTYGAPVKQPSYGAPPQSQYGSPSPAYSSSRSLGASTYNFETVSGYVLKALEALSDLYDSIPNADEPEAKKNT